MADEAAITIRGIEEVCQALDKAPTAIVKHSFAKALAAASVPIVDALLARAPVATGFTKSHIITDIEINSDGKGGTAAIGFGRAGKSARLVEYGHRMIGHKPDKEELGTVEAHPFMRPAAAASAEKAMDAFADSMIESLNMEIK